MGGWRGFARGRPKKGMVVTMAEIKIRLTKSLSGRNASHIATAHSLGLRKIDDVTTQPDNEQTRGKISKICYLVSVEEGK